MSLHSMTAFARESVQEPVGLIVELRSVNHRYLDCQFKLPDHLRELELRLREQLGKALTRGKVDCHIRSLETQADGHDLGVNEPRLAVLLEALAKLRARAPELAAPTGLDLLQFPGICGTSERSEKGLQAREHGAELELQLQTALELFVTALRDLQESRAREGAQLAEFLLQRLDAIEAELEGVRSELPVLRERQEQRLRRRLAELEQPVDAGRLEQELILLLQKSDVDEELDRLQSHIQEVRRVLTHGGPCGRRLDFLMQELNREANTLSSKSIASSTTQRAVELKVLIEQMREQVQNIE